jgi:hypothetical protein
MPDSASPFSLTLPPESVPGSVNTGLDLTLRPSDLGLESPADDTGSSEPEETQVRSSPAWEPTHSQPPAPVLALSRSPHLSERQFIWVTHRLSTADDLEACVAADVPADEVIEWRKNASFCGFLESALRDKNQTFRDLTSHMLPEAARAVYRLLTTGNLKDQAKGVQMLLRHQGLFVDTVRVQDEAAIASLLSKLREPGIVEIQHVTPRD